MLLHQVFSLIFGASLVLGLGQVRAEVRAAEDIAESFSLSAPSLIAASAFQGRNAVVKGATDYNGLWPQEIESKYVSIFEQALGKEFLFRFSSILPGPVSSFSNGASRVVAFKKVGDKLYLLEATDGHTINQDVPLTLILAEFPIVEEQGGIITFDFNTGMSQHFIFSSSWHGSDFGYGGMEEHFAALDVQTSYVDEATLLEGNRLFVRQVAQIKSDTFRVPLEVRYFLEPYRANPNFKVTRGGEFDRMGFFEVAPRYNEHGTQDIYATKFDISKPIVFAMSSNTPNEFRKAVRDGILYWNRAFGREIVQVVDAPEGVSAPHPDYNIIQWVDWPNAESAYADAQHDPRTGEVLNAQVWLSSAFAVFGKERAKRLLKGPGTEDDETEKHHHGLKHSSLCSFRPTFQGLRGLEEVIQLEDDKKIFEITSDYMRHITAHEVGHVLGLRHNFAGSLAVNYNRKQREQYFKNYLADITVPAGVIPGSSVMEYAPFVEAVFSGNNMRDGKGDNKTLTHDHMAIHYLYEEGVEWGDTERKGNDLLDPGLDRPSRPLFCTDSHTSYFFDCNRFDVFASPAEEILHQFNSTIHSMPFFILESFVRAKDPAPGQRPKSLERVQLRPKRWTDDLFFEHNRLMKLLAAQENMIQVVRSFEQVSELNEKHIEQITDDMVAHDIRYHGGIRQVLPFLSNDFVDKEMARFSNIFAKSYLQGVGPGGKGYEFNAEEVEFITNQVRAFYEILEREAHRPYLNSLKEITKFKNIRMAPELAQFFLERAQHYIMGQASSVIKGSFKTKNIYVPVDVPKFLYEFEIRNLATELLTEWKDDLFWIKAEKAHLKADYEDLLNSIFDGFEFEGKKFSDLKAASFSSNLIAWYLEQRKILRQLKTASMD